MKTNTMNLRINERDGETRVQIWGTLPPEVVEKLGLPEGEPPDADEPIGVVEETEMNDDGEIVATVRFEDRK